VKVINCESKYSEIFLIKYTYGIMAILEGFCELDNDSPGYVKGGEFFE
jgi:hypothetical protein